VEAWHRKLVAADVQFSVRDYREVATEPGALLYLDPPYPTAERYYGRIDFDEFFAWLGAQRGSFLLSLNGPVSAEARTLAVPGHLYDVLVGVKAGDMQFHRMSGRGGAPVMDSLYIRRKEGWQAQASASGTGSKKL
jgi:hypothetical protein